MFEAEGEYTIVVESVDKAERKAFSDVKSLEVSFAVDKTAPTVVLSGLESNGRYQTDAQEVSAILTDDGGKVSFVKVILMSSSGEPMTTLFEMSGQELSDQLANNDNSITFIVPEGVAQDVMIVCGDAAILPDGTPNENTIICSDVTVSPNGFLIFWTGAKSIILAVGGVVVLAGSGTAAFAFIKKN